MRQQLEAKDRKWGDYRMDWGHKAIYFFFDGESKGNPGVVGVGVDYTWPWRKQRSLLARGIGSTTDNEAKALTTLQWLQILALRTFGKITVTRDFLFTITAMKGNGGISSSFISRIIQHFKMLLQGLRRSSTSRYLEPTTLGMHDDKRRGHVGRRDVAHPRNGGGTHYHPNETMINFTVLALFLVMFTPYWRLEEGLTHSS